VAAGGDNRKTEIWDTANEQFVLAFDVDDSVTSIVWTGSRPASLFIATTGLLKKWGYVDITCGQKWFRR
jgi:hypothetical protein